ncbi:MAG: UDP-N-acetylmuramate dehydrogenase [Rickettsiales bacterium]|nr:UDP-N-acetylmuramate dehydrogenase [Rickettsiales bacterium]
MMIDGMPKVRGSYRKAFELSNVTWFRVGGPADILFKPADIEDLIYFLQEKSPNIPYMVLGVGSNLLVRDGGIRGVVIRLGKEFTNITHEGNELVVGAGALDVNVSQYCLENNLEGLEFLSGVPGVIGGALAMNAGAYGQEIADHLIKLEALDSKGNLITLTKEECGFKYRSSSLENNLIFIRALLKVNPGNHATIKGKIQNIQQQREESQPIRTKTSGSSFKNPSGHKAWQLIDQAGCRGLRIGDAMVSQKHCNFFINVGNATAKEIEELGETVRKRVFENSGVMLEWEIKIVGSYD